MSKFLHKMGATAKCKVTGFEGIVIARSEHITGCNTYGLKGRIDKDGKVQDAEWFDEGTIEVTGKGRSAKEVAAPEDGGDVSENPVV